MVRNFTLGVALLVIAIAAWAAGPAATPQKQPDSGLSLIPLFRASQSMPLFFLDYTNETGASEDISKLHNDSTITIDGKQYGCQGIDITGNVIFKAGAQEHFLIDLIGYYLPPDPSKKLNLDPGRHTLSVKFGGKDYGPIHFCWDTNGRRIESLPAN